MSSSFSVGGLVSGLDTNSLIDGLTSIEQQKVVAVQKRQSTSQATLSALGDLQSKFMGFAALARDLNDMKDFDLYKSTSSDAETVELTGGTEGLEGSFEVRVQQLASSWKVTSGKFASSTTDLALDGTLTFSRSQAAVEADPTKPTVDVTIRPGDTLKDIASKINSADNAGVSATLITIGPGDVRLMLTSVDAGVDTFTMTSSGTDDVGAALGIVTSGTQTRAADFALRQIVGGAATAATKFSEMFTGVGANNIGAGDSITLDGTDSAGNPISGLTFNGAGSLADATMGDLATWLGTQLGATVSVDSSGRLVATNASGNPIDFTLSMTAGSTGTLELGGSSDQRSFANVVAEGKMAFYTLNGLAVSSASNTDEDTLSGAKVVLKNVSADTDPAIQLTLKRDDEGIKNKVQGFLDSYNGLMSFIKQKSTAEIKETKDANGQTVRSYVPGEFTGQSAVQSLKSTLQTMMTSELSRLSEKTSYTSFASIGITTNKSDGSLTLDADKFQKAMNTDFDGMRRLFSNSAWTSDSSATVGGWTQRTKSGTWSVDPGANTIDGVSVTRNGDVLMGGEGDIEGLGITAPSTLSPFTATLNRGIAGMIEQFYNDATGVGGLLRDAKTAVQNQVTEYGKQVSTAQSRVDSYREGLVSQFSALEQAMLRMKAQSAAFMSQIGSIG
ncbi:MAG: flagellar filament capping protein FliD [Fibrobacteria bacterium]|nr:flagellar filament capping protein FliD [Fibrobacteria bacterium]